jgi:hypothetical protein
MPPPLIARDLLKKTDNVLVLLPNRLCIATLSAAEAKGLEQAADESAIEQLAKWDIPLAAITGMEARFTDGALDLFYLDPQGDVAMLTFLLGTRQVDRFLHAILERDGGNWEQVARRNTAGGIRIAAILWGTALAVGAGTAYLYSGTASGWINRVPTILAAFVTCFGLTGLQIIGGIITLSFGVMGLKMILFPGKIVRVTRTS